MSLGPHRVTSGLRRALVGGAWLAALLASGCSVRADRTAASGCPAGTVECEARCVDTATDESHCGGCGSVCGEAEVCRASECVASCGVGRVRCEDDCADLLSDHDNCGACGAGCDADRVCSDGDCVPSCGDRTECDGGCFDLESDSEHCGACETSCGEGRSCRDGTCVCTQVECSGACVDTRVDERHCGECGLACDLGEVCDGGQCSLTCGGGSERCGRQCVDLRVDPEHCGACGEHCATGEICSDGRCGTDCAGGTTRCGDRCADTAVDPAHCGACDRVCDAPRSCRDGSCACPGDRTDCGGECVDVRTDSAHCGGCDAPCGDDELCVEAECRSSAAATRASCDGIYELDLKLEGAGFTDPGLQRPDCWRTDGGMAMKYSLPTGTWAACDFATTVNMNGFDADAERGGVLEVEVCTEQSVPGEINLWYGTPPNRKKLPLVASDETLGPGCRTFRLAPEDALCHWNVPGLERECGTFCAQCGGECNTGCGFDFGNTKVTLIGERPDVAFGDPVTVTLKYVRFVPKTCTCTADAQCREAPGRPTCATGLFESTVCPSGSSSCGLCIGGSACEWVDEPCMVTFGGRSCSGTVRCEGIKSICEVGACAEQG